MDEQLAQQVAAVDAMIAAWSGEIVVEVEREGQRATMPAAEWRQRVAAQLLAPALGADPVDLLGRFVMARRVV